MILAPRRVLYGDYIGNDRALHSGVRGDAYYVYKWSISGSVCVTTEEYF